MLSHKSLYCPYSIFIFPNYIQLTATVAATSFMPKQAVQFDGAFFQELQDEVSDNIAVAITPSLWPSWPPTRPQDSKSTLQASTPCL